MIVAHVSLRDVRSYERLELTLEPGLVLVTGPNGAGKTNLLEAVRRAAVMAQRNTPLRLRFAEGELTISAQSQDVGETRESLAVGYAGEPLEIGFNAEFLRDGIESVLGDQLRLKLISPLRPAVLQGEGDDFLYLIMPIRLAG